MTLLDRAEKSATPVLNATLTPSDVQCNVQLYFMLMMLCKSTALTQVINASSQ